jgi:hypothetical protein
LTSKTFSIGVHSSYKRQNFTFSLNGKNPAREIFIKRAQQCLIKIWSKDENSTAAHSPASLAGWG